MISVLKLKSGNIASVANMFKFLGNDVEVITTRSQLLKAKKIVMPGIGSFDETMNCPLASRIGRTVRKPIKPRSR